MSKKNDIFDALNSHSDQPWEGDLSAQWDAIESRLDRRRAWMAWWWLPLAGAILMGSILLYHLTQNNHAADPLPVVEQPIDQVESDNAEKVNQDLESTEGEAERQSTAEETNQVNQSGQPLPTVALNQPSNEMDDKQPQAPGVDKPGTLKPINFKILEGFSYSKITGLTMEQVHVKLDQPKHQPWAYTAKPEIGVFTSPGWMIRQLSPNNGLLNRSFLEKVNGKVNASIGYQLGAQVKLPVADRWVIHTGIGITSMSESVQFNHSIDSAPVTNSSKNEITGYVPIAPALREHVQHSGINSFRYLTIPVAVQYRIPLGQNGWVLSPELGGSIWLSPSQSGFEVDPTYLNLIDLNQNLITTETVLLTSSISLRYETPNGLSFEASPFYNRMMMSAYQKEYPVQNKPYIYGINVGVNYTLGKK